MTEIRESLAPITHLTIAFGIALNEHDFVKMRDIAEQAKPHGGIKIEGFMKATSLNDPEVRAHLLSLSNNPELINNYLPVMLDDAFLLVKTQGKSSPKSLWSALSDVFNNYTGKSEELDWKVSHRLEDYFHLLDVDYEKMIALKGEAKAASTFLNSDKAWQAKKPEKGLVP